MTISADVSVPIEHTDRFFIGGEWVTPSSDSTITVIDSHTEQNYLTVAEARAADMDRAISAAKEAFDNGPWPRLSHAERAACLRALGDEVVKRSGAIAQMWPREAGVLASMAGGAAFGAKHTFNYYADLADTFQWERAVKPSRGGFGLVVKEPVGVVGAIIPWNAPMGLISMKLAPALIAGCTVILKTSPEAPGEGYVISEAAEAAGLPPGVLNVICADREVSELLVRDPRVDKITFTGSTAAGRRIASICGMRIARVTLELGGKSAAVILDDADIAATAQALARAECILSGQVCASLTRIVISRPRHDEMLDALAAAFSAVKVGDPFDPASQMGPLAAERQRDRVGGYIAKGIELGATLATGGGRPKDLDHGWYIEPTVFGNVDNRSVIAQEEIFGPVLSVIAADDEADAVRIANDTIFGLHGAVFTADVERAREVAGQMRTERTAIVLKALSTLESDAEERTEILSRESGKIRFEAMIDTMVFAGRFHQAAEFAPSLDVDEHLAGPPFNTTISKLSAGVVTIIYPFNWPLAILAASLPYALMAGNTVIVKPPPTTPLSSVRTLAHLVRALPPGVLNVVTGADAVVGPVVVGDPRIKHVVFTGSVGGGKRIMTMAAANVTNVTLELGGNDPAVVLSDAVLDADAFARRRPDRRGDSMTSADASGLRLLRVAARARAEHGRGAVGPLYEAVSSEIFDSPGAAGLTPAVRGGRAFVEPLLARAGLPAGLADALDDTGRDDEIRLEGDEALTLTGRDVGTPIIQFGPPEGTAFFGPVISRLPAPEDAVRLWDHVIGLAGFPGFAELKRSLRERPQLRSFGVDPDAAGAEEDWQAGRRKPAALDAPGRRRGLPSFRPAPPGSGDAGAGGSRRAGVKSEHTEQPGPPR